MKDDIIFKYARIKVVYNKMNFYSMWLDLDEDENEIIIHTLSDQGTSGMKLLKIPVSDSKFIIISKEQLDNSLIVIELSNRRTAKKTDEEITMIKS